MPQTIRTFLMFQNGQAEAALRRYEELVPTSFFIDCSSADEFGVSWQLSVG